MKRILAAFLLFALPALPVEPLFAGDPIDPHNVQVDTASVLRMGDTVQKVGGGFQAGDDVTNAFAQAAAVPPDDNHKWFVSVLTIQGCPSCKNLERNWIAAANKERDGGTLSEDEKRLLAYANPIDPAKSWSHFQVYNLSDPSQARSFRGIKIEAFPTILVQPPLNKSFGDPQTVVYQAIYRDPKTMVDGISSYMKAYVAKLDRNSDGFRGGFNQFPGDDITSIAQPVRPMPYMPEPSTPPNNPSPAYPLFPVLPPDTKPDRPPETAPTNPAVTDEEIVVVGDGSSGVDLLGDSRLKAAIERIEENRSDPAKKLRVRIVDFADAKGWLPKDVTKDNLPAVLHYRQGTVVTKLSNGILGMFAGTFLSIFNWTTGFIADVKWYFWFFVYLGGACLIAWLVYVVLTLVNVIRNPIAMAEAIAVRVGTEVAGQVGKVVNHLSPKDKDAASAAEAPLPTSAAPVEK